VDRHKSSSRAAIMRATIVRKGKPKVLRFEQIKDLAARWEKQLELSE